MQAATANRLATLRLLMDMPSAKIKIGSVEIEMMINGWIVRNADNEVRYDNEEDMMSAVRELLA